MNLVKKITPFQIWLAFLSVIMVAGVVGGIVVFLNGLIVTNLTDLITWGLWITIDLSAIALSAGAFSLCAVVYIIGIKKYQPVARTATFIGIIGYSVAILCVLMDLGRPDRFWVALISWNTHSVMWEVVMCIILYFMVLTLEILPILAEFKGLEDRWPGLSNRMKQVHHFAPYLAMAGLFFSMLHQSSLGAIYGVLQARPLWYTPSLSVLFMYSAIVGGISLTILASMVSSRLSSNANVDDTLLNKLSLAVGWALAGYLYFRFWYTFSMTYTYEPGRTEGLALLTKGPLAFNFWLGEIILGGIVPMVILLRKKWRSHPGYRMLALALIVSGVVAYRWDVNLSGQMIIMPYISNAFTTLYTSYVPSFIEIVVGAGIVAYGLLAFSLGVKYFCTQNPL